MVLMKKGFTKLWIQGRDGSRVETKGEYGEPRIHLVEYDSLPNVRSRLDIGDKLEWMSHPLSGYLLFFDSFELGLVWGCIMLERHISRATDTSIPTVMGYLQVSLLPAAYPFFRVSADAV